MTSQHTLNRSAAAPLLVSCFYIVGLFATVASGHLFGQTTFTLGPNDYERTPSAWLANLEGPGGIYETGIVVPDEVPSVPIKARGNPGVAILDYDDDGDLDVYVTNGPLTANSLFENQGGNSFVDVGAISGADATNQDSGGVCFGDLDNDGDADLLVLGTTDRQILYENVGGYFVEITSSAGLSGSTHAATSCSMGDTNGDGLLDIAIGMNLEDWSVHFPIFQHLVEQHRHNELWQNDGGLSFTEVAEAVGLHDTRGFNDPSSPPGFHDGEATITWAISIVDYDGDGDQDLIHTDDQGPFPHAGLGGFDRGLIHIWQNDGDGSFTDTSATSGTAIHGAWMGLAFADYDHDGTLDLFATNSGDYLLPFMGLPVSLGENSSRWFFNNGDGTFADPGVGPLVSSPFGWGASAIDVDNDSDTDTFFVGGLEVGILIVRDNPGALVTNDGTGNFALNNSGLASPHSNRNGQGVATGDLNGDGCDDLVSVSNADSPVLAPLGLDYGSVFDASASFIPTMMPSPTDPSFFIKTPGVDPERGTLAIELNDCNNGNNSSTFRTVGSVGITRRGGVNRDGIGAVLSFTPYGRATAMRPVLGGASHMSQDALDLTFGMADATVGRVDVLWPGGVKNRVYGIRAGERVTLPEIPCSYDTDAGFGTYVRCVRSSLRSLRRAGVVRPNRVPRLFRSAIAAYFAEHQHGR